MQITQALHRAVPETSRDLLAALLASDPQTAHLSAQAAAAAAAA